MKIRLTPIVIITALLLLGLKVGGLLGGADALAAAEATPAAVSTTETKPPETPAPLTPQAETPQAETPSAEAKPAEEKPAEPDAADTAHDTTHAEKPAPKPGDDEYVPGRECSSAELAVMADLNKRRAKVQADEKALAQREALVAAAEEQFNAKLAELNATRDQIKALLKQQSEEEEASLRSLVKMYEIMKPADAARIFDTLDMAVLTDVATRMKEAKLAPIVGQMTPDVARDLTMRLAARSRKDMPPVPQAP